jgi:hypothetical protein
MLGIAALRKGWIFIHPKPTPHSEWVEKALREKGFSTNLRLSSDADWAEPSYYPHLDIFW